MTRLGIFGGSFNPVHLGHVGVARRAIDALALDRLIVIPASVSPFKTGEGVWSPAADKPFGPALRLEMVRAAFADVARAVVDDRELRRGGVSFAIDTVREIAAENPGAKLYYLIGEDSAPGLPKWKSYEELSRLVEFSVFPRTRESSTEVRRRLAAGEPIDDLVPPAVAKLAI